MSEPFEVGEKVVCVDDSRRDGVPAGCVLPRLGATYVVRGLVWDSHVCTWGVYVIGTVNPLNEFHELEWAYWASRFRRLSEVKREMAALRKHYEERVEELETPFGTLVILKRV